MNTQDVITAARQHATNGSPMESSARLCLADAIALANDGELDAAKRKAIRSLAYSVGVFHPDYKRATAGVAGVAA